MFSKQYLLRVYRLVHLVSILMKDFCIVDLISNFAIFAGSDYNSMFKACSASSYYQSNDNSVNKSSGELKKSNSNLVDSSVKLQECDSSSLSCLFHYILLCLLLPP